MSKLLEAGKKTFHMLVGRVYKRQAGYWTFWLELGEEEEGCISSGEYMWWLIFCAIHFRV